MMHPSKLRRAKVSLTWKHRMQKTMILF